MDAQACASGKTLEFSIKHKKYFFKMSPLLTIRKEEMNESLLYNHNIL